MFALVPFLISLFTFPTLITNIFGFRLVGLTGGISTGKSTVTRTLKNLGIPVIDFDLIAREVVSPNSSCLNAVKAEFGDDIINSADGTLNRTKLGDIIFNNAEKRKKLNAIMQRPIMFRFLWLLIQFFFLGTIPSKYYSAGANQNINKDPEGPLTASHGINTKELYPGLKQPFNGSKVVVLDCPLLFESGIVNLCSSTLFINCDQEVQITRLMARDGITREQASAKINAQWNNEMKLRMAKNVINNNGTIDDLYAKITTWWNHITSNDFGIVLTRPYESFTKRMSGLLEEQGRVQGLFDDYIKELNIWKRTNTSPNQQNQTPAPQPPLYTKSLVYPSSSSDVLNKNTAPSFFSLHHPLTWCIKPTMLSVLFIAVLALPSYIFIQWFEKSWFTPSTVARLAAKDQK